MRVEQGEGLNSSRRQVAELSVAIEQEMRRLSLWSERPPSAESLASVQPFCHDTLCLCEWLQWVFLPRIDQLLGRDERLPSECDIASLAELWFERQGLARESAQLLALIRRMDQLLSSGTTD